jgi:hypothetical protein
MGTHLAAAQGDKRDAVALLLRKPVASIKQYGYAQKESSARRKTKRRR